MSDAHKIHSTDREDGDLSMRDNQGTQRYPVDGALNQRFDVGGSAASGPEGIVQDQRVNIVRAESLSSDVLLAGTSALSMICVRDCAWL